MIYLVTGQQELFEHDAYKLLSVEKALQMMSTWKIIQVDSETSGRDCHVNDFLCVQFGNDAADAQIVVDTNTINIKLFKNILESTMLVLQNAKFDLQFFYNYGIIPRKIYDIMIVEQLLHLGYPYISISPSAYQKNSYTFPYLEEITKEGELYYSLSFSLKAIAQKRLGINIDKTVRGEIIWRGLDAEVIKYAAGDIMYLEKIMWSQIEDCKKQGLMKAAKIECDFVPCISYLEWCGVHLDQDKWRKKMIADKEALEKSEQALNAFVIKLSEEGCVIKSQGPKQLSQGLTVVEPNKKIPKEVFKKYVYINNQGDLFTGFDLNPHCSINWSSSKQVVKLAQELGFDTTIQDKKTGEDKDSVMEKHLKSQKGINDEFLKLYFDYQGYNKVVTSFGQGHLNAINPKTNRIHTTYKQLGCASGRMSCGSEQNNSDLAKFKGLPPNPSAKQKKEGLGCSYPNMQQLPADEITRSCFTAPKGYKWSSCDYSALESRLGADIYNEKSMLDEFLHGSGDMHSLCAYMVYKDIIPRDTPIKDIKKLYPHQRKDVKPIEFSQQFGGSEFAIQGAMGCTLEEAKAFKYAYDSGFPGITDFKIKGSKFVRENGYILMCKYSGHKMYWWDYKEWIERQKSFTQEFWEDYRINHKGTGDAVAKMVSMHFKAASKYDRMALNAPTQGSGIVILKIAMTNFFDWIVDNGYFGIVEIATLVHDESNIIYPEHLDFVPKMQQKFMEEAANLVCLQLPIPAEVAINDFWEH